MNRLNQLESGKPRGPRRWLWSGGGLLALAVVLFFVLPRPPEPMPPKTLSLDEIKEHTAHMRFKNPPALTAKERRLAQFGRKLFNDRRISRNGKVACASCHIPELSFTDGKPTSEGVGKVGHNAPTLINVAHGHWFRWDGGADSAAAQAIGPVEHPAEHGFSRVGLARHIYTHYQDEYLASFGQFPKQLDPQTLPEHGLPRPQRLPLSVEIGAYALATLDGFSQLNDILDVAQAADRAPALELTRRVMEPAAFNPDWIEAWEAMPEDQRMAVNEVTARFGEALDAFQRGIVTADAPFDLFADKLQTSETLEGAAVPGFGPQEIAGLKLYLGRGVCQNCHTGPTFSDQQFHNIGLPKHVGPLGEMIPMGRAAGIKNMLNDPLNCQGPFFKKDRQRQNRESCRVLEFLDTENLELVGAFKTPTLRNLLDTAPYFHDGRAADLDAVLDHYDLLEDTPAIGHREESLVAMNLSDKERQQLIAFLKSLQSSWTDRTADAE